MHPCRISEKEAVIAVSDLADQVSGQLVGCLPDNMLITFIVQSLITSALLFRKIIYKNTYLQICMSCAMIRKSIFSLKQIRYFSGRSIF